MDDSLPRAQVGTSIDDDGITARRWTPGSETATVTS